MISNPDDCDETLKSLDIYSDVSSLEKPLQLNTVPRHLSEWPSTERHSDK